MYNTINIKHKKKIHTIECFSIVEPFGFSTITRFMYNNNIYILPNNHNHPFFNYKEVLIIMNLNLKIQSGFVLAKSIK